MSKRKIMFISAICVLFLAAAAVLFRTDRFYCDRCHLGVKEKPIHISEHTVDMTICSGCYQDYIDGKWRICQS